MMDLYPGIKNWMIVHGRLQERRKYKKPGFDPW